MKPCCSLFGWLNAMPGSQVMKKFQPKTRHVSKSMNPQVSLTNQANSCFVVCCLDTLQHSDIDQVHKLPEFALLDGDRLWQCKAMSGRWKNELKSSQCFRTLQRVSRGANINTFLRWVALLCLSKRKDVTVHETWRQSYIVEPSISILLWICDVLGFTIFESHCQWWNNPLCLRIFCIPVFFECTWFFIRLQLCCPNQSKQLWIKTMALNKQQFFLPIIHLTERHTAHSAKCLRQSF